MHAAVAIHINEPISFRPRRISNPIVLPQWLADYTPAAALQKKLRPGFGGSLAAREPVWDGEGWGCDRVACSMTFLFFSESWPSRRPGGCRRARPTHSGRPATGA